MRWLWRFTIYFIRPLAVWYIACYFGYQSIRAVAYAVTNYQRSVRKAELKAGAEKATGYVDGGKTNYTGSAGRRSAKRGGVNSGAK